MRRIITATFIFIILVGLAIAIASCQKRVEYKPPMDAGYELVLDSGRCAIYKVNDLKERTAVYFSPNCQIDVMAKKGAAE